MNLIVIEKTNERIQAEAHRVDLNYSDFIKDMIFNWRNNCNTKKIPEFTNEKKKTINISANEDEEFSIKWIQIQYYERRKKRLAYWQMIEAAWVWYCFNKKEKNNGRK